MRERFIIILLAIGVAIFSLAVWTNQKVTGYENVIVHVFAQGLTVAAWVSLWTALANFLINWVPHRRQIKRYERIAQAQILFQENPQTDQRQSA